MPDGIKQLKAGPAYRSAEERLIRDQVKSFMKQPEMVDQQFEKLFKVLAPDMGSGFVKNDLVEFLTYLEQSCGFSGPILSDAELNKMCKDSSISEVKNNRAGLN